MLDEQAVAVVIDSRGDRNAARVDLCDHVEQRVRIGADADVLSVTVSIGDAERTQAHASAIVHIAQQHRLRDIAHLEVVADDLISVCAGRYSACDLQFSRCNA